MTVFAFRPFLMALIIILSGSAVSGSAVASEEKKPESENAREHYIKVPPIVIIMYHRGRPKGSMVINVLVKLSDSEKRATAQKYLPRLNSAYLMEASRLSHDYFDITRPVNVAMLGDSFQQVTNKILGHRQAQVLISDVIVNKK